MMKRNSRILIILFLILLISAAAAYFWQGQTAVSAETPNAEDELQTAVAREGELVVSAIGAGTVIPVGEVGLSFDTSGQLTELLVRVGDTIAAGDIVARVDDTEAQQALLNSRLQLAQAQMQADSAATSLGLSFDDINIAQAALILETVQAELDALLAWESDPDALAQADAALAAAQASYNAANGQEAAASTNIAISGISVDQAERELADAQQMYDVI
jgi:multidrug efflux pump subunit AcrA (membrane-fusion protein)